jgi:hypothetical protein
MRLLFFGYISLFILLYMRSQVSVQIYSDLLGLTQSSIFNQLPFFSSSRGICLVPGTTLLAFLVNLLLWVAWQQYD